MFKEHSYRNRQSAKLSLDFWFASAFWLVMHQDLFSDIKCAHCHIFSFNGKISMYFYVIHLFSISALSSLGLQWSAGAYPQRAIGEIDPK